MGNMDNITNRLKGIVGPLRDKLGTLTLSQKVLLAGAGVLLVSVLVFVLSINKQSEYEVLYSDLSQKDAAAIVEKLEEDKIEYRLADNGTTILVPLEDKYTTRLTLASENLPQGEVGFELFRESSFGETQTDKQVKYREALQGELARTIQRLDKVQAARVNIAIPEQSLFLDNEEEPTASVVINTVNGDALNAGEVKSIINLVANSVERLDAENVVIVDQYGNLVSEQALAGTDGNFTEILQMQLSLKKAFENEKQTAIQTMLDKTLGKDNSVVRVNAELEFDNVEQTSERYDHDPDGPFVRSEQIIKESGEGEQVNGQGVPGTDNNIPEYQGVESTTGSSWDNSDITRNYEINRTETTTRYSLGDVKYDYLTVSVFVDNEGAYQANLGETDEARAQKIRNIVAAACGLRENRNNENVLLEENISVEFIDFYTAPEPELPVQGVLDKILDSNILPMGFGILALILILIFARSIARKRSAEDDKAGLDLLIDDDISIEELAEKKLSPEEKEKQRIKEEIDNLVDDNPEAAAQVVKAWLMEDQR